jgi:uncharacterized protein YkwD
MLPFDRPGDVTNACDNLAVKKIVRGSRSASSRILRLIPVVGFAALLLALSPPKIHAPMVSAASMTVSPLKIHAPMISSASMTVPGDSPISIALVNPHPHSLAVDAQALADGVNTERAKHGLPALRRDATLDQVAYAKAVDMAARGYFGHTDLSGVTFADRMHARHLNVYASENIAFDSTEANAQSAFVHSPDHYSAQIDPRVQNIGAAVITVGGGQTFYVEDFSAN